MDPSDKFWWNWWVSFGAALATFLAVIAALFGDWIRGKLFSPKLRLELKTPLGEKNKLTLQRRDSTGNLIQIIDKVRYYHVNVINDTRWLRANQVQVYLIRIEEPGPDSKLQISWTGEVPISWRHQKIHPLARTIGSTIDCDLCSVGEKIGLQLHPLIVPNNLEIVKNNPTIMVISLQARANEGESAITQFKLSLDGKWDDGDKEMSQHLIVEQLV